MSEVVRLYKHFVPKHYEIKIEPNKENLTFSGTAIIIGQLQTKQNSLLLHSKELQINLVTVNNRTCLFTMNEPEDQLQIELPSDAGANIVINIEFGGQITRPMHGLYPCYGRDGNIILATQFESHHAREVFPCIDEPEAKATFSLSLITGANEVVLANTLPKNTIKTTGRVTTVFEDTPKMSTYLLAFVIGNIKKQQATTNDGILVQAWATPDQAKHINFALDVAKRSLQFFNDYFEIPYPLKKCDLVALPDFAAGAMENWGLLTFRETSMLVDPNNTSLDAKQFVAMTVAHEVAHQWFGNLVTMQWWDDLWLNEGFASWIEFMCVDKLFPDWNMWTQFIASEQQAALRLDALKNTHPIEATITNPDEINAVFDSISYAKGASVIHMLHEYLGKNDFRLGLAHYLKKHSYGTAVTADLWQALHEISHKQVAAFMSSWTSQPGFPLVKVAPSGDNLHVSQKRFLPKGLSDVDKLRWSIPLQSNTLKDSTFSSAEIDLPYPKNLDNFKINQGQSGFYITKYWVDQYRRLGRQIDRGKLPEIDRIGLLADMLALTKNGYLSALELFMMLEHYHDETSAAVWDIIAASIGDTRHVMGEKVREAIKPLVSELTITQVSRLGWAEQTSDSYFDKLLRPTILAMAANADNQDVINNINEAYAQAKSIEDIPSNIRNVVLSTIARYGSKPEFDQMFSWLSLATAPENTVVLAHAMTNFRKPAEIKRALYLIKSPSVRLQDVHYWIVYSLANPVARGYAWQWLKDNWQWLKDTAGGDHGFSHLPMYVARAFSDVSFIEPYQSFFKKVYEPSLDRTIKQGLETIKMQAAWRKRDEQALLDWLATRKF